MRWFLGLIAVSAIAQTTSNLTINSGTIDFGSAIHVLPAPKGLAASKPATCTVGEMYFATDATAGQNWYFCTATNVWTQQLNSGGGGGGTVTVVGAGSLTSTAIVTGGGTTTIQTPSSAATVDSSGNANVTSLTTGAGGGATGQVKITGGTSSATSVVTVDANNTATTVKLPNDATAGLYAATVTSGTPASGCAQFSGTGTQLTSTAVACGSGGGGVTSVGGLTGVVPGGWVLQEQHTASSSAELDFTTCFSASYDDYQIEVIDLIPATNSVSVFLQVSTNGGVSYDTTSDYFWGRSYIGLGSGGSSGVTTNQSSGGWPLWLTDLSNGTFGLAVDFHFFNPAATTAAKKVIWQYVGNATTGSSLYYILNGGFWSTTSAVNAFRIIASSGNIASGVARCYGIAKQ